MKSRIHLLSFVIATSLLPFVHAAAQPVLIEVTGIFNSSQAVDEGNRQTLTPFFNQPYTFIFSYDPTTPDQSTGTSGFATFDHTVPPNRATFASSGFVLTSSGQYTIGAGAPVIGDPNFFVFGPAEVPVTGLSLPNDLISLNFAFAGVLNPGSVGFLQTGQGTEVLPDVPFFLDAPLGGLEGDLSIQAGDGNTLFFGETLRGSVTSVRVIPEPSSLALLGLGGLLVARRRRTNSNRN